MRVSDYDAALKAYSRASALAPGIAGYRLREALVLFEVSGRTYSLLHSNVKLLLKFCLSMSVSHLCLFLVACPAAAGQIRRNQETGSRTCAEVPKLCRGSCRISSCVVERREPCSG